MADIIWQVLFLLLPIAALTGWYVGRRPIQANRNLEKLLGLSDLLGRRTEKSAEAVIDWLDANKESVETHLTLGSVFRRRGEVDKAIQIHQNLISKSTLTPEQRASSILELSRDYMRAGVLDRAENSLKQLVDQGKELEASLQHLIDIYQQSKDWLRAIETAEKLQKSLQRDMSRHVAHFYCELAEQGWLKGEREAANNYLKQAIHKNPNCVRVSMLLGGIEAHAGHYKAAIKFYQQVQKQDQAFLSEIILPLTRCYENLGNPEGLVKYLSNCLKNSPHLSVVLAFAELLKKTKGEAEAIQFVLEHLQESPSIRGLNHLVQFTLSRAEGQIRQELSVVQALMEKLIANKPFYRCHACGFSGRTLQWQCPGCKRWDVIKPIHE